MNADYTGFILAAYGFSVLAIVGLIAWLIIDSRVQKRALADLDARGIRRRSTANRPASAEGA